MPRMKRLILDNACYHIMARGNQKQNTFLEAKDYRVYFKLLKRYRRKYDFALYGYCLMPNHVHLVIKINKAANVAKIMQGLNQSYTLWFNNKYKKVGHLWQGRFKSLLIENGRYMLECLEYVEFNPVRSNLVSSPFVYPWSSWKMRNGNPEENSAIVLDSPEI